MIGGWVLTGIALLLLPVPDPSRRRLDWLAGRRWPAVAATDRLLDRPTSLAGLSSAGWWAGLAGAGAVAGVLVGVGVGPVPGVLAALTGWTAAGCRWLLGRERRAELDLAALADAVTALVAEYSAGATMGSAFSRCARAAGRFGPALVEAGTLARHGGSPEAALAGEPALASLAVACGLVSRAGASFAELVAGVRADLAADRSTRRSVRAAVSGPRSSAMLLAVLPLVGLAMGTAMGADPGRVLLRTPVGLIALAVGVLLDLAGVLWTLMLTRPRTC